MKKILLAYAALVVVVIILAFARFGGNFSIPGIGGGNNNSQVVLGAKTFNVELAKDDTSRMRGLSNRDSLPENSGMIFVFEKPGKYGFWMNNTKIALDIIYLNNERRIVDIVKNALPQGDRDPSTLPIYYPKEDAMYVLEINAGQADQLGISIGDTIEFKNVN